MMKIVQKVIYPIITKTASVAGFHLNEIACQGCHYGIVTTIDPDSYRPISIAWDENEPFAYTEDEIRVLKIKVVEQLLPEKTIVCMSPGTTVLLENGEQLKFDCHEKFLVKKISDRVIEIKNITTKEAYQFQLKDFPGNVNAHIIEPPKITAKPIEELPLSLQELQYKAEIWLLLNLKPIMLANLTPVIEQKLKHQWSQSLQQPYTSSNREESDYLPEKNWQYQVEQFRYKRMKRRLQSLETISQLNLEKMPLKY